MSDEVGPGGAEDAGDADGAGDDPVRLAFVCVQNAGRSQMSYAFAEREVERRGLGHRVELLTGGTHPADHVHEEVVDAMAEVGSDVSDRTPRAVTDDELNDCDYVATMGCSTLSLAEGVEARDWALADPDGKSPEEVAAIRDEIESLVVALFDEAFGTREGDEDDGGVGR
ncbi:low molecular weight phosphatase family protein [Halobaculum roseum]|uniref:Low molecular weight phosphatase family protein n=1 Tax=Halobaculum roseum TaxID=2175149 RepID=A0ABD5MMK5_9EURY|nr:low molecular weight phosphatase family protein [Halobaculum roseum]QZY03585.1 low molecular weight phosphatase family protein [Halobaculum roseum]